LSLVLGIGQKPYHSPPVYAVAPDAKIITIDDGGN
jgi:hypothetical protein